MSCGRWSSCCSRSSLPARRGWDGAGGRPGGVHRDRLCVDQWLWGQELPPSSGVTVPTAHRRFARWTEAALWRRLHQAVLDELGSRGEVGWSRAILDAASVRAEKGGDMTGPNPVDRGKPGSKIHVVSDRSGPPLAVGVSARTCKTARHSSPCSWPSRASGPDADRGASAPRSCTRTRAYDIDHLRRWLRRRGIAPRITRKGIESSDRLGRHRWVVERTISWSTGYHRLTIRYERQADNFRAFLTLAAALTCFRRLTELAT
ncbi:IS5 family transposase [Actinosynnema sp. NPDC023794]